MIKIIQLSHTSITTILIYYYYFIMNNTAIPLSHISIAPIFISQH